MPRRIDEIQGIGFPVGRLVIERDRLGLDGDTALALDLHTVKHLLLHLAARETAANLDQAVGEGGLSMIDMGDDGEITDTEKIDHGVRYRIPYLPAVSPPWSE